VAPIGAWGGTARVATCAVLACRPRLIPTYSAGGPVVDVTTVWLVSTVIPWAACAVDA
jgi:hypothetical protein